MDLFFFFPKPFFFQCLLDLPSFCCKPVLLLHTVHCSPDPFCPWAGLCRCAGFPALVSSLEGKPLPSCLPTRIIFAANAPSCTIYYAIIKTQLADNLGRNTLPTLPWRRSRDRAALAEGGCLSLAFPQINFLSWMKNGHLCFSRP